MSDYRVDFGSVISPNDAERLYGLLSIVTKDDELVIRIGSGEPDQVNTIVNVLQDNDFEVLNKGEDCEGENQLIARRKH
jgi:hypothetical protein